MNREFLKNYNAKESEEIDRISRFPMPQAINEYKKRFPHIQEPIAWSHGRMSIWPQIPLCGTLMVRLSPLANDFAKTKPFAVYHGFDAADVEDLVTFARRTGRISFVLGREPIEYLGLDFLDPIFQELKPPRDQGGVRHTAQQWQRLENKKVEFDTLAKNTLYKEMMKEEATPLRPMLGPGFDIRHTFRAYANTYGILDLLGYTQLTQLILDALLEPDAGNARQLLSIYQELIAAPAWELIKGIHNVNPAGLLNPVPLLLGKPEGNEVLTTLPRSLEIGKFLMQKLVPYPTGFEACRAMCDRYDHYDLQRVLCSLQEGVSGADYSEIESDRIKLTNLFENVWQDSIKVEQRKKMFGAGIPLALAVLGSTAGGLAGSFTGLLAGLGFAVADKLVDIQTDSLSEMAARHLTKGYLVNIFDFRKRYGV